MTGIDIKFILLIITAVVNVALSLFILIKRRTSRANVWFAIVLLLIAYWSFAIGMFRVVSDTLYLEHILRSFYIAAALIAISFFYFARHVPTSSRKLPMVVHMGNAIGIIAISFFVVFSDIISNVIYATNGEHEVTFNYVSYLIYSWYFFSYIILSFSILVNKWKQATGYGKRVLAIVILATFIAAFAGAFFDLILPLSTYRYIWIGPYFTVIMAIIIVRYIIMKPNH